MSMNKPRQLIQVAGQPRNRAGFTLAELLVAVGAVLLLSIGIGQIFKQVSKLVGTGSAVAELDQYARAIERQLRDDFAALARTPSDQTFLAIRGRRLGDIDRSGSIGGTGERNIYLSRDDAEAELRGGVTNPYGVGGRGVSPRIDEIMFLAIGGQEGFPSSERGKDNEEMLVTAPVSRIYYGHGLRPAPPVLEDGTTPYDTSRPLGDTAGGPRNLPIRSVLPDGISGTNADWGDAFGLENTRNQYAGDFFLLRQSMLLYGGLSAGFSGNNVPEPLIGRSREYAPFIRDMETVQRVYGNTDLDVPPGGPTPPNNARVSIPRLVRQGRTDICGQNLEDVRRWLEGMGPFDSSNANAVYADATAFDGGRWNEPNLTDPTFAQNQGYGNNNYIDRPLWIRQKPGDNGGSPLPATVLFNNLKSLQSAIAGCFTRMLAESEPAPIVREEIVSGGQLLADPADSLMDIHATLASRCSSFEVAWSDGTTWRGKDGSGNASQQLRIDLDGDNKPEVTYNLGDIIWFDYDFPRHLLEDNAFGGAYYRPSGGSQPEILSESTLYFNGAFRNNQQWGRRGRLNTLPNNNTFVAKYDTKACGGADTEYLALWGFREPTTSGEYGSPWVKPRLVRIRMTLHDSQLRIAGGRQYEFIFSIDQN